MDEAAAATGAAVAQGAATVSRSLPVPLHIQIRNTLLEQIGGGRLSPGQQLPRERELARQFGVSLAPVRQALLDLAKDGYLQRFQGRGTFVRGPKVEQKIAILSSFTESLRAQGVHGRVRVLRQAVVTAPAAARTALHLDGRRALLIERLASVDAEPVAVLRAYLAPGPYAELGRARLDERSLYGCLREHYGIELVRAESVIEVIRCDGPDAALLGLAVGSPALLVQGITFDTADRPVEFSRVTYRADRFRFALESHRRAGQVLHLIGGPAQPSQQGGSDG